jgi:hypothetical protein
VVFSGGGLAAPVTKRVTVGTVNYRLNVISGTTPPAQGTNPGTTQQNWSAWVAQLGRDLYGRSLSQAEVNAWVARLRAGTSRASVVSAFVRSAEYKHLERTRWVRQTGQDILGRSLTSGEVSSWVRQLEQGSGREVVVSAMMDRAGYTKLAHGKWLQNLSQALLGRTLSSAEATAWVNLFHNGGSRTAAIVSFLAGSAYRRLDAAAWAGRAARAILDRALTSAELQRWVNYLVGGGTKAAAVNAWVSAAWYTRRYLGA